MGKNEHPHADFLCVTVRVTEVRRNVNGITRFQDCFRVSHDILAVDHFRRVERDIGFVSIRVVDEQLDSKVLCGAVWSADRQFYSFRLVDGEIKEQKRVWFVVSVPMVIMVIMSVAVASSKISMAGHLLKCH